MALEGIQGPEALSAFTRRRHSEGCTGRASRRRSGAVSVAGTERFIRWLLAQKPWIVPIPGRRKLHRLDENLGAADVKLAADELSEIEDAASKIQVQGGRYNKAGEAQTNL